jgi:hypothetical protein
MKKQWRGNPMNLSIRSRPAVRGVLVATGATLLLAALAGCSEDEKTLASWSKDGGQKHILTIAKDVRTLIQDSGGSTGADAGIASRCSQVLDDVKAARAYGELPDKLTQAEWKDTLDLVQTTASHCLRNVKTDKGGVDLTDCIDAETAMESFLDQLDLARSRS